MVGGSEPGASAASLATAAVWPVSPVPVLAAPAAQVPQVSAAQLGAGDAELQAVPPGGVPLVAPAAGPEAVAAVATPVLVMQGPTAWERLGEELLTWFKTLASAAVYATLIVTFVCQVARVEGQSMSPTLEDQDRLIVNKLIYRVSEPHRGDIVMLYYPVNPDKSFVKRVIAEENQEVRIVDGRVTVDGEQINDVYVPPQYRSHDDFGPFKVREGYYFVMGDHRNNSSDSRHWGEVPKKYIIGKVQLRWWPLAHARIFQ